MPTSKKNKVEPKEFGSFREYVDWQVNDWTDETDVRNKDGMTIYDYAVIHIASRKSEMKTVFAMEWAEAMELCSDKRTSWVNSFACWTHLYKHLPDEFYGDKIDLSKMVKDNGSMNEVIKELGLTKIKPSQFKELFEPFGIVISGKAKS